MTQAQAGMQECLVIFARSVEVCTSPRRPARSKSRSFVPPKARGSFVAETFLPTPDHRLGLAGGLHDLGRAATIGRQKHNLGPPNVLLRAIAVSDHGFKLATVGSAQLDIRSLVHPPDSHTRALQGIPKRIEVSDLDH